MVYDPPASGTRAKTRLGETYLARAGALTVIAALLCEVSLSRVRLLLPEYPDRVILGPYAPLPPVWFFHSVGATGLIVFFLIAIAFTMLSRKVPVPSVIRKAGAGLHLAFLVSAMLAYGFCLWRVSRVLASFP